MPTHPPLLDALEAARSCVLGADAALAVSPAATRAALAPLWPAADAALAEMRAAVAPLRAGSAERRRLALELHDVVGHAVAVVSLQAGAAQALAAARPAAAREHLVVARRVAAEGVAELATLLEGGPEVVAGADDVAHATRRIVQEAVTNAARHGAPALVTVARDAGVVRVEVVSEVREPAGSTSGLGLGLAGMRERAAGICGAVDAGRDGAVWRVRAALPVAA